MIIEDSNLDFWARMFSKINCKICKSDEYTYFVKYDNARLNPTVFYLPQEEIKNRFFDALQELEVELDFL